MPEPCSQLAELAPELVRGRALDPGEEAHVASCAECARVVSGARSLGRDLASLDVPAPPGDLVARTLARVRLAAVATPALEPARPKRRTAAELLETWALPGPVPVVAKAPGRAWVRLAIQAAAAVLVFACCTVFTLEFYPAYVEALEERNVHGCQEHLQRLAAALERYAKDHPEAVKLEQPLQGLALRDALVRGGYATEEEFLCPSVRAARPGSLCYFLRLPDGRPGTRPLAWDRFGNHGGGALNVVREHGTPELLEGERLWQWLAAGRE
jgi:hypothetical protein